MKMLARGLTELCKLATRDTSSHDFVQAAAEGDYFPRSPLPDQQLCRGLSACSRTALVSGSAEIGALGNVTGMMPACKSAVWAKSSSRCLEHEDSLLLCDSCFCAEKIEFE